MSCQCRALVKLPSMNKKICADCKKEYEWKLEPDQKPLISSNRADRNYFDEARMDIIGQNGNDGEHYE